MPKVIIIGAGIVGAQAAYQLARQGVSVTLIEAKKSGRATAAAAGIICPWLSQRRNKAWYELARKGAHYYEELITSLAADGEANTGFKRVGALRLLTDEQRLDKLFDIAAARREESPEIGEIKKLSKAETKASFPFLVEDFYSLYISGAARIDGRLLCEALINGAVKYGAKVLYGKATFHMTGEIVAGVNVDGQIHTADKIIAANGAWMNELLAPLKLNIKFEKRKGQLIHLSAKETAESNLPIVMALHNQYLIPFDAGKIVIGATTENITDFSTEVTASGLHSILDKALETAPGLAQASFTEARTGFRPYTSNFLPIFGEVASRPNLLLANGLGASGLTTGPFIGLELANIVLGKAPNINLANYTVN